MKVLFLTNLPSPYMVDFFNEFGKLCELTVIFERGSSSERNGRWDNYKFNTFEGIILKGIATSPDSALSLQILRYLKPHKYDFIIVTNPSTPTGILAIQYMRFRKISYILESEGSFPKNGLGIKEKIKKYILSDAYMYFSTTEKADEYFLAYGAEREAIAHYPFTSLYRSDVLERLLTEEEKQILRSKLQIKGERIAIAAGRLIPLKRYDDLILAWKSVPKSWFLYIAGEGEEKERLQNLAEENSLLNVIFLGYKEKEELFEYYRASDLFVHPTSTDVWGLVLNEAMACGLPVITTEMCIAGNALVQDAENGYIIKVGDVQGLLSKIQQILQNKAIIRKMAQESLDRIQDYTFENMAKVHLEILKNAAVYSKNK